MELAQLVHGHRVPQVDVGRGGIVATVDAQGPPLGQPLAQLGRHDLLDLLVARLDSLHQNGHLLVYGFHLIAPLTLVGHVCNEPLLLPT